ncbi:hypothetical protein PPYR_01234 [Photinus pyralis]|uniref:RNA-directed DNA polymerase n=1 Tax=Photinus pyralis TaxID=7054 RepID=A0A5N4B3Y5_PHOPY|nr:hypothetical protein PPYR_01234 [Photinus pyralis]
MLNYDTQVIYKPGKYLYIPDTLSRAFLNETNTVESELDYSVHTPVNHLPVSENLKNDLKQATHSDQQLQLIINFVHKGWPKKKCIPELAQHFYKLREFLVICDNLLFFKHKLVVPLKLRKYMLTKLHEGHIGIENVKIRARQIFYWPCLSQDIELFIKSCKICERFIIHYQIDHGREYLGVDIFSYANKSYLVIMDAYSNWLELILIKNKSAHEVILKLKSVFSKYGCPDLLVCDNVPFNSYLMSQFSKEWNFDIVTRSPYYPKSNGLAEKAVGIAKTLLKKSIEEGKDIF